MRLTKNQVEKIVEPHLGEIKALVDASQRDHLERSFLICRRRNKIIRTKTRVGTKHSVSLGNCPDGFKELGSFHTHPVGTEKRGIADTVVAVAKRGHKITCIASSETRRLVCYSNEVESKRIKKARRDILSGKPIDEIPTSVFDALGDSPKEVITRKI